MGKASLVLFVASRPLRVLGLAATDRLRLHLSRVVRREGFCICTAEYIDDAEDVVAKVAAALRLIESTDPRRYRRMHRDISRILVSDVAFSTYSFVSNTCVLDLRLVRSKSSGAVAVVVVHEATHARLYHMGIVTWRRIQARVERACVREQIAFARLLGDAGWNGIDRMIGALEGSLADPWWTDARQFEARLQRLNETDLPRWIVRGWAWWYRPTDSGRH